MAYLKNTPSKVTLALVMISLVLLASSFFFNIYIVNRMFSLLFLLGIMLALSILFFILNRKTAIKTPDDIWRRKISYIVEADYSYGSDLASITAYFNALIGQYGTFKLHRNDVTDIMHSITSIELRGRYSDYPAKIYFDEFSYMHIVIKTDAFPYFLDVFKKSGLFRKHKPLVDMEMQIVNSEIVDDFQKDLFETSLISYARLNNPFFKVYYDPEKIPTQKDPDDAWSKEDISRVFIDNGIYIFSGQETAAIQLAVFSSFSTLFRDQILKYIKDFYVYSVELGFEEFEIVISDKIIGKKPVSIVNESLQMLAGIASETATVPVSEPIGKTMPNTNMDEKFRIVVCSYCSSKYPLMDTCKCPNCGASYS